MSARVPAAERVPTASAASPPMPTDANALPMLNLSLHDKPRDAPEPAGAAVDANKRVGVRFGDHDDEEGQEHEHVDEPVRYVLKIDEAERAASTRAQASFLRIRRALRRKVRARVPFGNQANKQGLRLSEKAADNDGDDAMEGATPGSKFPIIDATVPANAVERIDFPRALAQAHVRIREVTVSAFELRKHLQRTIDGLDRSSNPDEYDRQVRALEAVPCATKMLRAAPGMPAAIKRAAQARGIAFEHGLAKAYKMRAATAVEKESYSDGQEETIQLNPHSNPEISSSYVAVYISPKMDDNYTATEFSSWEPLFAALHQTLTKMLPIGQYQDNIQGLVDQTVKIGKQFLAWKNAHRDHEFRYAMPYSKGARDAFASTRRTFKHMATGGEEWHLVPDVDDVTKRHAIPVRNLREKDQAKKYYRHIAFHTKDNVWPFLKVNADVWAVCRELNVEALPPACRPLFVQLKSMKLTEVCKRINGNRNGIYVSMGKFRVAQYHAVDGADYVSLKFNRDFFEPPHIIASRNNSNEIEYNVSQLFSIIVLTGMRFFVPISKKIVERKAQRKRALEGRKNVQELLDAMRTDVKSAVYAIKNYGDYLTQREQSRDTLLIRAIRRQLHQGDETLSTAEKTALQTELADAKKRRDDADKEFRTSAVYKEIRKYAGFYKRRADFYEQFAGIIAHTFTEKPFYMVYTGTGRSKDAAGLFNAMGKATRLALGPTEQWNRIFTLWARSARGSLNYARLSDASQSMGMLPYGAPHVFPALDHFETPVMASFFAETTGQWVSDALCDWSTEYVPSSTEAKKSDIKVFKAQPAEATREIGASKWVVWAALNILRAVDDDAQLAIAHKIGELFYSNHADANQSLGAIVRETTLKEFFSLMRERFRRAVTLVQFTAGRTGRGTEPVILAEPNPGKLTRQPITIAYDKYGPGFVLQLYSAAKDSSFKWHLKGLGNLKGASINKSQKAKPADVDATYPGQGRSVSENTPAFKALHALKDTLAHLYNQAMDVCETGAGQIETRAEISVKGAGEVFGTEFGATEVHAMDVEGAAAGPSTAFNDGDEDDDDDDDDDDDPDETNATDEPLDMSDDLVGAQISQASRGDVGASDELMNNDDYVTVNDAFAVYSRVDLIEAADVALDDPDLQYGFPDDVLDGVRETYQNAIEYELVNHDDAAMETNS